MEASCTFTVNHDIEKVFAFLLDYEELPKWMPDLISAVPHSGDPNAVGGKMVTTIKEGSKHTEYLMTTKEVVKNQRISCEMLGWGCGKKVQEGVEPAYTLFSTYDLKRAKAPTGGNATEVRMSFGMDDSKMGFFMRLLSKFMILFAKMYMKKFRKAIVNRLEVYQPKTEHPGKVA